MRQYSDHGRPALIDFLSSYWLWDILGEALESLAREMWMAEGWSIGGSGSSLHLLGTGSGEGGDITEMAMSVREYL